MLTSTVLTVVALGAANVLAIPGSNFHMAKMRQVSSEGCNRIVPTSMGNCIPGAAGEGNILGCTGAFGQVCAYNEKEVTRQAEIDPWNIQACTGRAEGDACSQLKFCCPMTFGNSTKI